MTFTKKVFFYSRRDTGGKLRIVVHRRARDGGRILRLLLMASARGTGEKSPPSPVPRVSAGAGEKSVRCRRPRAHSGAREAEGEEEDDILEPCWRKPRALSRYRPRGRGCGLPLRCGRSRRAQKRRGFFWALPAAGGTLPQPARRKGKELRGGEAARERAPPQSVMSFQFSTREGARERPLFSGTPGRRSLPA